MSLRAKDDKSDVTLFLNVGTRPGDSDVLKERPLGGPSTIIKDVRFKRGHFFISNMIVYSLRDIQNVLH